MTKLHGAFAFFSVGILLSSCAAEPATDVASSTQGQNCKKGINWAKVPYATGQEYTELMPVCDCETALRDTPQQEFEIDHEGIAAIETINNIGQQVGNVSVCSDGTKVFISPHLINNPQAAILRYRQPPESELQYDSRIITVRMTNVGKASQGCKAVFPTPTSPTVPGHAYSTVPAHLSTDGLAPSGATDSNHRYTNPSPSTGLIQIPISRAEPLGTIDVIMHVFFAANGPTNAALSKNSTTLTVLLDRPPGLAFH